MDGLLFASDSSANYAPRAKDFLEKMCQTTPVSRVRLWHRAQEEGQAACYRFSTQADEAKAIAFVLKERLGMLKELCLNEGQNDRITFLESIHDLPSVVSHGHTAEVLVPAAFIENPLLLQYCENSLNCIRQNVTSKMSGTYVRGL